MKILLVSPSGHGKTLLALTCGEVAQIFDLDMGIESALGRVRDKPDAFTNLRLKVDHVPIPEPTPTLTAVAYEQTLQYLIGISNDLAQPPDKRRYKPKVLIIDSFTLLCDAAMRYVLRNTGRLNRPVDVKSNITQPEWGLMINEIEKIILLIRGLPIHVILIAHTEPLLNERDQVIKFIISIPTKRLPPRIPAYFDEVWFLETQDLGGMGKKRVLRTEASSMYDAKSRAGLPDMTDVNLGMREIFKRLGREL